MVCKKIQQRDTNCKKHNLIGNNSVFRVSKEYNNKRGYNKKRVEKWDQFLCPQELKHENKKACREEFDKWILPRKNNAAIPTPTTQKEKGNNRNQVIPLQCMLAAVASRRR